MKESQYLREKYEAEALAGRDDSQELIEKTISVKISLKHYSMLKALGDRFSDPISGLGGQFLEEEIENTFSQLASEDMTNLADQADTLDLNEMKERGFEVTSFGLSWWASKAFAYLENRKEKARKDMTTKPKKESK